MFLNDEFSLLNDLRRLMLPPVRCAMCIFNRDNRLQCSSRHSHSIHVWVSEQACEFSTNCGCGSTQPPTMDLCTSTPPNAPHTHSRNAKCKIRHDFIFSKFNKSKVNLFIKHFQLINQQHSVLNSPRRDDDDGVEKKRKCYNAKMHRQLLYEFKNEKEKNVKWTAERKKNVKNAKV